MSVNVLDYLLDNLLLCRDLPQKFQRLFTGRLTVCDQAENKAMTYCYLNILLLLLLFYYFIFFALVVIFYFKFYRGS